MARQGLAWGILLGVLMALPGPSAKGADRFYSIIFGSQSNPKRLRYTHTWATFVRVVDKPDAPGGLQVYQHTISWLPATLDVRTFAPSAEKGVNLDLYSTLNAVAANGESVTAWGPFYLRPDVYARSLQIKAILESGAVQYRAIDTARDLLISDCIHAVAAVDPDFGRRHYPLIRVGKPASRYIARQIVTRSQVDQHRIDAGWLLSCFGLDHYPIEVISPEQIPHRGCVLCRRPE